MKEPIQSELESERALVVAIMGTLADMVKEWDDVDSFNDSGDVGAMLDDFVSQMRGIVYPAN